MSWWTDIRDSVENFAGGIIPGIFGKGGDDSYQKMINEQIRSYREQTELTKKQLEESRSANEAEKRRVQEKQIRSLRNNYRAQGLGGNMLGNGQPASEDMSPKLGG